MLTETVNEQETTKEETFRKHILPSSTGKMAWILGSALLACVIFSACTGALAISVNELWQIVAFKVGWIAEAQVEEQKSIVFWIIRLPRVCLAVLIGAALGIAGASLQGLFRNPIADATLIGVTSGASLFAVFVMMLNVKYFGMLNELAGAYSISFVAFLGAACTTLLVYQLIQSHRRRRGDHVIALRDRDQRIRGSYDGPDDLSGRRRATPQHYFLEPGQSRRCQLDVGYGCGAVRSHFACFHALSFQSVEPARARRKSGRQSRC
jgi:hypothetical protein